MTAYDRSLFLLSRIDVSGSAIEESARRSYIEGYNPLGAAPYAVCVTDTLRQRWLKAYGDAAKNPATYKEREAGFASRAACLVNLREVNEDS